jgi:L-iditol 2-dehydrogenase
MRAAILTGPGKIVIKEINKPGPPAETEVLLKVKVVGVCGSDMHYYKTGRIGDQVVRYPFIVGHELAAQVVKTGKRVTNLHAGDKVAVDPAISCGQCDQCAQSRFHTCRQLTFLGNPGQHEGCLCEYIVMPARNCYRLPKKIAFDLGVMAEPLSIGIYAVRLMDFNHPAAVAILGVGPIGLSVLLALKDKRVNKIFVTDKIETRLNLAKKLGAVWSGNPDSSDVVKEIINEVPLFLDAVFDCSGDQKALNQAVELLKPGGQLILVGIPEKNRISFNINKLRRKELVIKNVRRQNECSVAAIDLAVRQSREVKKIITHRFPLLHTEKAFDLVAGYRDGVVKALIQVK